MRKNLHSLPGQHVKETWIKLFFRMVQWNYSQTCLLPDGHAWWRPVTSPLANPRPWGTEWVESVCACSVCETEIFGLVQLLQIKDLAQRCRVLKRMSLLQHLWQKIKLSKRLQVHHFSRTLLRAEVAGHQWAPNPGIDRLLLEGWAMATATPGQTQPDPQPDQPTSWYRLSVSWWEMWSLWNPQVEGVHLRRLFSMDLRGPEKVPWLWRSDNQNSSLSWRSKFTLPGPFSLISPGQQKP